MLEYKEDIRWQSFTVFGNMPNDDMINLLSSVISIVEIPLDIFKDNESSMSNNYHPEIESETK